MRFLMCLGENEQPALHEEHFNVARLDAGIAFDDRVDRVVALAEVTRDQHFAAAQAQHEGGWSVLHAEVAVKCGHGEIPFVGFALIKRFQNSTTTVQIHSYCTNNQ